MDSEHAPGTHWDAAYDHGDDTRSWYQTEPAGSLRMADQCGVRPADSVLDVGAGASPLVDALLRRGHRDLTLVDVSETGLAIARERLADNASAVDWQVADVLTWRPGRTYAVWHDRAVFHFLTTDQQRARYLRTLNAATTSGSLALFATFAPDGPEFCSGLPVARYDAHGLADTLGQPWQLIAHDRELHTTPNGKTQPFTWTALRRHEARRA